MNEISPLMVQYQQIKDQYKNEVLFFRLGDFYEMFNEDAIEISRLLNLTLTHRADNPMCGIPYHASKGYIARLLRMGKKIAICEQTAMPASGKGLAERKVIEVITPGTAVEEEYLEQTVHNYLAAVCPVKTGRGAPQVGFAYIDVSTGTFSATSWTGSDMAEQLSKELGRAQPRELILAQSLVNDKAVCAVLEQYGTLTVSYYPDWHFAPDLSYKRLLHQFGTANLRAFSLSEHSPEVAPAGFLLDYLSKTTVQSAGAGQAVLPHVTSIRVYHDSEYLIIDDSSRRNLEIVSNLRDGSVQYSLLESVQYTVTPMGNRMLRSWLSYPLTDISRIQARQEQVSSFFARQKLLQQVRDALAPVLDIERLAGRIAMERAHAKDLQALRQSLESCLSVRTLAGQIGFAGSDVEPAGEMAALIARAIIDDPATSLTEGRLIKPGYSPELDHLHEVQDNFNGILNEYLEEERRKTGIQTLKIRNNRIIGYYIEVSRGKLDNVPPHFILRRSLVNGDRYTTARLQELEHELMSAGEKIIEEERDLFLAVRAQLAARIPYLLTFASEIAYLDVTASLAHAAHVHGWVCPELTNGTDFAVEKGRHPVVEMHLPSGEFVPNDADLCGKPFALVTGPNMAGKSTYLRQNALIVILAQSGSFVPAAKARIGIVDSVFCRVGASDNLARGESTFLVEMTETARILHSATSRSLVIMDEVGRGTSTEDGLSIAWAVSEYLLNTLKAKTFFATHYHELSRLEHPALQQLCLDVLEDAGQIVFLKQIKPGSAASSYGIHVAKLAGIPVSVITRAQEILDAMQQNTLYTEAVSRSAVTVTHDAAACPDTAAPAKAAAVPGLFGEEELVLDEILSLETDTMTPLEALQKIARWKKTLSGV